MSNQFHNRLVGTIVVVALGVIFLPDLLDGKHREKEEGFTEIPLRPSFSESGAKNEMLGTVNIPVEPDVKPEISLAQPTESNNSSVKSNKEKIESPPVNKNTVVSDVAFTIQLGSFNNAVNVNALVDKLRKNGFSAYTVPKKPIDKKLTKVFVGPNISSEKLKEKQSEVESLTNLKGKIVSFNPVEQ